MKRLDAYYRALCAYREAAQGRECDALRRAVARADASDDGLEVSCNLCTVDTDWIEAIEKGLVFVENAIREDRQFIEASGEVVPIEKLRRVSEESVRHLARHSNLITREGAEGELIPDKLYSAEKSNDFAVYENRFLYMLLCSLRDFITLRYEKIAALAGEYEGTLRLKKSVSLGSRKIRYALEFHEERTDETLLMGGGPLGEALERIGLIMRSVLSLLSTPLMQTVAKAPMLRPPIVKTNVLRMDNDFRGAAALYDYITAYDKPGYTTRRKTRELAPFSEVLADELAETAGLFSFLTLSHGLDLRDTLRERMESAEKESAEAARRESAAHLGLMKRRLERREESPEAYILALEKQVRELEADRRALRELRGRMEKTEERADRMEAELARLREENALAEERLGKQEALHGKEKEDLLLSYEERIASEKEALRREWEGALAEREVRHGEHADKLGREISEAREILGEMERKLRESEEALAGESVRTQALAEENLVLAARIKALQSAGGEHFDGEAFTEREDFEQLEREFEAFVRFYDERWGITKRSIRRKLLRYGALKTRARKEK